MELNQTWGDHQCFRITWMFVKTISSAAEVFNHSVTLVVMVEVLPKLLTLLEKRAQVPPQLSWTTCTWSWVISILSQKSQAGYQHPMVVTSPGLGEKSGPGVTVRPVHSIHGVLPTQCIARINPVGPPGIPRYPRWPVRPWWWPILPKDNWYYW